MAKVLLGHVKGDKGEPGDQGLQGLQGLQGDKGEKGDPGPTTVKKDEEILDTVVLKTERSAKPTGTMTVQLQDIEGNPFYVETSPGNIYYTKSDGSETTLDQILVDLVDLIDNIAFYDASYNFTSRDNLLALKKS